MLLVLQKPCINTINTGATSSVYLAELGGSHGEQVGRLFLLFSDPNLDMGLGILFHVHVLSFSSTRACINHMHFLIHHIYMLKSAAGQCSAIATRAASVRFPQ